MKNEYHGRYRQDSNQSEIVRFLEACACSVQVLSNVGNGLPDILVGVRGQNYLLEIKSSEVAKHTKKQLEFYEHWRGQWVRVNSINDVIQFLKSEGVLS